MTEVPKPLLVYVVEDSAILLGLLVRAVEEAGAVLIGKSDNAQQAIADLSQLHPDLILLDMALKSGTGLDVLKALQQGGFVRTALKVVFTNHATPAYREICFRLGATHFFDKSLEGSQALELLNTLAAARRCCGNNGCHTGSHDPTDQRDH